MFFFLRSNLNDDNVGHIKRFQRQLHIQPPDRNNYGILESFSVEYENEKFLIYVLPDNNGVRTVKLEKTQLYFNSPANSYIINVLILNRRPNEIPTVTRNFPASTRT